MNDFMELYKQKIQMIDDAMEKEFDSICTSEPELREAMHYSVFGGGKRIRSILCVETCTMLGGKKEDAFPFATAIEMIHAFSLIHDDLPCMDNDDFRRGMPSCHKKFGEAIALLAGDGLLNTAYEIMANKCAEGNMGCLKAFRHIARSAGINGMINGQVRDIKLSDDKNCTEEKLIKLIEQKTMALIMTGVMSGAYIAKCTPEQEEKLNRFAYDIGIAFQIRDDFEDEAEDMAEEHDSPNFINTLGRENAYQKMITYKSEAIEIINEFENNEFIKDLVEYLFKK